MTNGDTLPPKEATRARLYVGSIWGIAALAAWLAAFGNVELREAGLGLAMLLPIALILWLVTWRDRGGNWLLAIFAVALAFSEGGFTAAGLPIGSTVPVMIAVAWAAAAFFIGEQLRRAGWFAP